jgi:hypothetical protein
MKKAFIVTSLIDITNGKPLSYSKTRTFFSPIERFHQTVYTITAIDIFDKANCDVFLIDASDNYEQYRSLLSFQDNLKFISIKEEFPEHFETIRTYPNKTHGECLMLCSFLEKYKQVLANYDYTVKLSGRYYFDSSVKKDIFNDLNRDKIFFKKPLQFTWQDSWNYNDIDLRYKTGDNLIRQYCSVMYGWGKSQFDKIYNLHHKILTKTGDKNNWHYDIESLMYFYSRELEQDILETDWMVLGCNGVSGLLMRY